MPTWGKRLIAAAALGALMGGCGAIEREQGYPGGNIGFLSDRLLFAKGPTQQVDRTLVALAFIAPLAAEAAGTPEEARIAAARIRTVFRRLAVLKKTAETCDYSEEAFEACAASRLDGGTVPNTLYAFQTLTAQTDQGTANLLAAIAESFGLDQLEDALSFDPTKLLGTLSAARNLVGVSVRYFATYRDVTMIVSASALRSCPIGGEGCDKLRQRLADLRLRTRTADLDQALSERPINDLYREAKAVIGGGLNWRLEPTHVAGLLYHIDRACQRLENLQALDDLSGGDDPATCSLTPSGDDAASRFAALYDRTGTVAPD